MRSGVFTVMLAGVFWDFESRSGERFKQPRRKSCLHLEKGRFNGRGLQKGTAIFGMVTDQIGRSLISNVR